MGGPSPAESGTGGLAELNLSTTILRPVVVYGPGVKGNLAEAAKLSGRAAAIASRRACRRSILPQCRQSRQRHPVQPDADQRWSREASSSPIPNRPASPNCSQACAARASFGRRGSSRLPAPRILLALAAGIAGQEGELVLVVRANAGAPARSPALRLASPHRLHARGRASLGRRPVEAYGNCGGSRD